MTEGPDMMKGPRKALLEWVGDDERVLSLVHYADSNGVQLRFIPGRTVCFIDVMGPGGTAMVFDGIHSMVIDLVGDRVTLFGSEDIRGQFDIIDKAYAYRGDLALKAEIHSLLKL